MSLDPSFDFFTTHGLAIDLRRKRLLSLDSIPILLQENTPPLGLSGVGLPHLNECSNLLRRFPELLIPHINNAVKEHGAEHLIVTHARARRLDQEKLNAAKAEFLHMEEIGIVRRSKSPWSSLIHIGSKSDDKWRPCGD